MDRAGGQGLPMSIGSRPGECRDRDRHVVEIPTGLCRRCVRRVSRRLRDLPGVAAFEVDAVGGRVWIDGDVDLDDVARAVSGISCG